MAYRKKYTRKLLTIYLMGPIGTDNIDSLWNQPLATHPGPNLAAARMGQSNEEAPHTPLWYEVMVA